MKIRIEFDDAVFNRLKKLVEDRLPSKGYWRQPVWKLGAGNGFGFSTFSGKGVWEVSLVDGKTVVAFDGYRGSFADGNRAFATGQLPWDKATVVSLKTSAPTREIFFEGNGYNGRIDPSSLDVTLEQTFQGKVIEILESMGFRDRWVRFNSEGQVVAFQYGETESPEVPDGEKYPVLVEAAVKCTSIDVLRQVSLPAARARVRAIDERNARRS